MRSTSKGFTKRILATVASIPSATSKAAYSKVPKAKMATRLPAAAFDLRRTSPLPNGRLRNSFEGIVPTPAPRG